MAEWEPTFEWEDATFLAAILATDSGPYGGAAIWALYSCLVEALGPLVDLDRDSGRQGSDKRRKGKAATQDDTNNAIKFQAAKMTKCIVNYMSAQGSTAKIIEYGADFTGDFDLSYAGFNLDVGGVGAEGEGTDSQSWARYYAVGTESMIGTSAGAAEGIETTRDYDYYLSSLAGTIDLAEASAVFDIDESIYEDLNYVASPVRPMVIVNEWYLGWPGVPR